MSGQIIRRLRPEEEEIVRKREELVSLQATLLELEVELADLRGHLAAFEARYLREVGILYAELDEWKAQLAELKAQCNPSSTADRQAQDAREQARRTHKTALCEASQAKDFAPTPELKGLFRDVARRVHPDLAKDSADQDRRTRLMADANRAYEMGDSEALRQILDDYEADRDEVDAETIGAELIRLIRQISRAKSRLFVIEREMATLRESEIAKLESDVKKAEQEGRNLLEEIATSVRKQIRITRQEYETFAEDGET